MTSVSSDPSVATTEKQGADQGSDFNQIVYGCTLCIHEQNTALGGLFFIFISRCQQGFTVDIKGTAVQDTTCKRSLSSSVPTTPATSSSTEAGKTLIWFY